MKTSDLEGKIEESRKESEQPKHKFSNYIFTDDKMTRYSAIVIANYSASSASGNITLRREDVIKKLKTKYKLKLFPRPKIITSEEFVEEYKKIWEININELFFEWTINDWNRLNDIGTYGIVGRYREIEDSLKIEARRKKLEIKEDLINLLTSPVSAVRHEFDKYLQNIRIPMIEKGLVGKTIIYSNEIDKIREIRPNWDIFEINRSPK